MVKKKKSKTLFSFRFSFPKSNIHTRKFQRRSLNIYNIFIHNLVDFVVLMLNNSRREVDFLVEIKKEVIAGNFLIEFLA